MLVKLTHRGKPTLVNMDNVLTIYTDHDFKQNTRKTKVVMGQGIIVFVDETLEEVLDIVNMVKSGEKVDYNWEPDFNFDDRIESAWSGARSSR